MSLVKTQKHYKFGRKIFFYGGAGSFLHNEVSSFETIRPNNIIKQVALEKHKKKENEQNKNKHKFASLN